MTSLKSLLDEVERRKLVPPVQTSYVPVDLTPKQLEFVNDDRDFLLFAGSLGAGKSIAALAAAVKYVHRPEYRALIVRKTFPELTQSHGLIDISQQWWGRSDAEWKANDVKWVFPSGAQIQFGHLATQDARNRYQGSEYHAVFFDEADTLKLEDWIMLCGRVRKPKSSTIPLRRRALSNPWVPGKELWVYDLFINTASANPEYGVIHTKMTDNPYLDIEAYEMHLKTLPPAYRRAFVDGEWGLDFEGLLYPLKDTQLLMHPPKLERAVYWLGIDLGSSITDATTAWVVCGLDREVPDKVVVYEAGESTDMRDREFARLYHKLTERYPNLLVTMDHGALGASRVRELRDDFGLPVHPAEKSGLKVYAQQRLRAAFMSENVFIVRGACEPLVRDIIELRVTAEGEEDPSCRHHTTDALLYAWRQCAKLSKWGKETVAPKTGLMERIAAEKRALGQRIFQRKLY